MFISFANFYRCFIQGFSRIVSPLTLLLKQLDYQTWPRKRLGLITMRLLGLMVELIERSWICSKNEKSRNLMHMPNIEATREPNFLTSNNSWIQRVWALVRSGGPKSSSNIISELIIDKARLMELQTLYFASLGEASIKKKSFESKTVKFFIVCIFPLQKSAF